jgi:hypothetical protein
VDNPRERVLTPVAKPFSPRVYSLRQ